MDAELIRLDGTATKSRLAANAVIGVSLAAARAQAASAGQEPWQYLAETAEVPPLLPVPHFNVVNGGAHAANPLDFQEFILASQAQIILPRRSHGTRTLMTSSVGRVPTYSQPRSCPLMPRYLWTWAPGQRRRFERSTRSRGRGGAATRW
ncbi:hypothetical protein [Streptomyces ardesiacus]|uniref:hypothetical protein n=1 Tax=Streptomyces ardesiacus TaxID=285564 RepID=UPI003A520BA5